MEMNQKIENPLNKLWIMIFLLMLLIVSLGVGIYFGGQWLIFRWHYVSTDDAQVKGNLINLSTKFPGRIVQLMVDEEDSVQPGQSILVVNDPGDKWVVANVEETKVRRVRKGPKVKIKADAFPGKNFEG